MLPAGLLILATGYCALTSCAVRLGRDNPRHRMPGRLPTVAHPRSYMSMGMLAITLIIIGATMIRGRADIGAWAIAATVLIVAFAAPFVAHNRRLPR